MSSGISDKNSYSRKANSISRSTLYSDLNLLFKRHPNTSDIRPVRDLDAVKNSIKNLLLTNSGDRPFHPEIGCNVTSLLFEPDTPYNINLLKTIIKQALKTLEPRLSDIKLQVLDASDRNAYFVNLGFSITNAGDEEEISFYLERLR